MKKSELKRQIKALNTRVDELHELLDRALWKLENPQHKDVTRDPTYGQGQIGERTNIPSASHSFPDNPSDGDSAIVDGHFWTFTNGTWQSTQAGVLRQVTK